MLGTAIGPRPSRALLLGASLCLAGFLALALVAAQDRYFGVDHGARAFVRLTEHPLLDRAMRGASVLGEDIGLVPLIALGSGLLWITRRRWALALPLLMAGTGVLQFLAKWAVDRPRPNLAAWGFPSGHVLSLVVFFGLVAYLLCASRTRRRWQCLGSAAGAFVVLSVAFSRLYLEAHWVSDVAGGFMLGTAYLLLAIWLAESGTGARDRFSTRRAPAVQIGTGPRAAPQPTASEPGRGTLSVS